MRAWPRLAKTLPTTRTDYPVGTYIATEKGWFYIAGPDKRFRIISGRVLESWSPPRIVPTTEAAVAHMRVAAKLKFRNGSLIHSLSDGRIYLVVEGKRRAVVSPEAFDRINSHPNSKDIITVSKKELDLHELGEDLA